MVSPNRRNIYILAFTLVVMMLGLGVVIPIMPFYIENLGAGGTELGLLVASYAAMRLIFGPIWGGLSDRYGRKPILMLGVLGYGAAMVLFGLSTELWMLFVSRMLSGILSSATSPTTMAYISDSTTEEERGAGMGILGAAMGVGTILGPGLGGLLGGESLALPFFVAGGMSFLAMGLIAVFLPESLSKEDRVKSSGKKRPRGRWALPPALFRMPLSVLFFNAFLMSFGMMIFYGVFGLYALEKFGFGTEEVGVVFMVFGAVSAVVQGGLSGVLIRRFKEEKVILVSLLATSAGFLLFAFANAYIPLLLAVGFFTLATAMLMPATTALTSKWSTLEQGATMGWSNAFMSLGRILGPLWAGFVFDVYYELPYLSGAAWMVVGFVIVRLGFASKRQGIIRRFPGA